MDRPATFAERLNSILEIKHITKAELSRMTGINKSSLTRYTKGDWEGKQDAVYAIAQALQIDEAWLMGYDVPMNKIDWDAFRQSVKERDAAINDVADLITNGVSYVGPKQEYLLFKTARPADAVREDVQSILLCIFQLLQSESASNLRSLRILGELVSCFDPEQQNKLISYAEFIEAERQKRLGVKVTHAYQQRKGIHAEKDFHE